MRKTAIIIFSIVLSMSILTSCSIKKKTTKRPSKVAKKKVKPKDIHFYFNKDQDLTTTLEMAEKQGKHVFVDFYADWCLPCQLMDEEVFNKPEVYKFMNKNFINYKVDVEKTNGANLRLIFGAEHLPTLLFLDEKGKVIERYDKVAMQTKFMEMAKNSVKKN